MNNLITNYIFEYYDAITSGRIRAGKWIKLIYKILVEGIKGAVVRGRSGKPAKRRERLNRTH